MEVAVELEVSSRSGTVLTPMEASPTDRRFSQTQDRYAADDLETMQEARRYSDHVFGMVRGFVGSRVLEVGSGIGTMTRRLVDVADVVVGIEPNRNCATRLHEVMGTHPRFTLRHCHFEECNAAELASHRFDSVLLVNVLEHIADDVSALKAFERIVVPGGRVIVFVPALQMAYGPLDAELGHHRRYSKRSLRAAFAAAPLSLWTTILSFPLLTLALFWSMLEKIDCHADALPKISLNVLNIVLALLSSVVPSGTKL